MKKLFLLMSCLLLPSLGQAHQFSADECEVVANVAGITVLMQQTGVPQAEAHARMDEAIAAAGEDGIVKDASDKARLHALIDHIYSEKYPDPYAAADAAGSACKAASKAKGA